MNYFKEIAKRMWKLVCCIPKGKRRETAIRQHGLRSEVLATSIRVTLHETSSRQAKREKARLIINGKGRNGRSMNPAMLRDHGIEPQS